MVQDWDGLAEHWEDNPQTEQFAQFVFLKLQQLMSLEGTQILDFGCGTGLLSAKLAPVAKDIVALDASESMIEELDKKQLGNVEPIVDILTRGLAAQHPAFRAQFDLVVASSVLTFMEDTNTPLAVAHSLLHEGGYFVHFDWLDDEAHTMNESKSLLMLQTAGFNECEADIAFEIKTEFGIQKVVMGVGRR